MKQKPFAKLKGKLREYDISYRYLAECLNRGPTYVCERMKGKDPKKDWTTGEAYLIIDMLGEDESKIYEYFPPKGIAKPVKVASINSVLAKRKTG